jgi:ABC-type sulfate transport system substrate-binding protein
VAFVGRDAGSKVTQWQDLAKGNIKVITANPKTSGGARWNFLGLWGSVTQRGGTEQQAQKFVKEVFANAPVLPKDAREASDVFFKQGQGNLLLNYENEMILAKQKGTPVPYSVPTDFNISIDNPVAVVDANVDKAISRYQTYTQLSMVSYAKYLMPTLSEVSKILHEINHESRSMMQIVTLFEATRQPWIARSLVWLTKLGILKVAN